MKEKNLLIVNDAGIFGGGAEQRIRLLADKLLHEKYFDNVHLLYNTCHTPAQNTTFDNFSSRIHFHLCPSDRTGSKLFIKDIFNCCKINIVQLHNVSQLIFPLKQFIQEQKIGFLWFAHDYWPLCAYRNLIDPYRAYRKKNCERIGFFKCLMCQGLKKYLYLLMARSILENVKMAIAPGRKVRDIFINNNMLNGKWSIVSPWIDDSFYKPGNSAGRNLRILFIGTLTDYKGAQILARAVKYISSQIPGIKVIFAGSQQERGNIFRENIDSIGKADKTLDKMEFIGNKSREELKELYQSCALLVFPSVCDETFGLVWAEAMACGCPVVASDIGGISEHFKEGGYLFNTRSPEDLAEKALRVLKDKNVAEKLSMEGPRYVKDAFGVDRAFEDMSLIYDKILSD